ILICESSFWQARGHRFDSGILHDQAQESAKLKTANGPSNVFEWAVLFLSFCGSGPQSPAFAGWEMIWSSAATPVSFHFI
ncbi:MAG: hypothetical protein WBN39_04450, partial [Flavobacteriaceae bacterium]